MILQHATVPWFPGLEMEMPGQVMQLLQHIVDCISHLSAEIGAPLRHAEMIHAICETVRLQHAPDCDCGGDDRLDPQMADFYLHIAALLGMVYARGQGGADMGRALERHLTKAAENLQ